jgi:DNA-binding transcriptional LysR family regulator
MDQLTAMRTFVRVADRGSFSAVARELALAQSQVSRQVAQLEQMLGANLLTRTTRRVTLTPEGAAYLEHARRALAEADEGLQAVRRGTQRLHGRMRLAVSGGLLRFVLFDPLEELLRQHPELALDFLIGDERIDLGQHGADLAVRAGELDDSGLVGRKLAELTRVLVASRGYLSASAARSPPILSPAALEHHQCLVFTGMRERRWLFRGSTGQQAVAVSGRVSFSVGELVREGVMRGLGVGLLPLVICKDEIASGQLVRLLPEYEVDPLPVHAVYPASRRRLTP